MEEDTPFVVEDEYSRPEIETSQSTIKQPPSPSKVGHVLSVCVCVSSATIVKFDDHVIVQLRRVSSLPELWGAFLLCDLGLTSRPDSELPLDDDGKRIVK